jgi:hypothetical protein
MAPFFSSRLSSASILSYASVVWSLFIGIDILPTILSPSFQLGEFVQDLVEARRDFDSWSTPSSRGGDGATHELSNWPKVDKVHINLDGDYGAPVVQDGHIRHHRQALVGEKYPHPLFVPGGEGNGRSHIYAL